MVQKIHNIIFDLGGIILNIDYHKTEQAFMNLGIINFNELFNQFHANDFFKNFEKGKISPGEFVKELRNYAPKVPDQDIIDAWNAMLLDFPPGRVDFLRDLKTRYRTFLLSNTNAIHHQAFQKIPLNADGSLEECFEKSYYSHEMGLRKPEIEIFRQVIKDNNLLPHETLFVDDTLSNVEAAMVAHINAIFQAPGEKIEELLAEY